MDGNTTEIMKDNDPRMSQYAGDYDRIIFIEWCDEVDNKRQSLTVARINQLFTGELANKECLLQKAILCMETLQCVAHGDLTGISYGGAPLEYPLRYRALLDGLSGPALQGIRITRMEDFTMQMPADYIKKFCNQFEYDRYNWQPPTVFGR